MPQVGQWNMTNKVILNPFKEIFGTRCNLCMYESKAQEFFVNAESDQWKHCQLLGLHQLLTKRPGEYCKQFLSSAGANVQNFWHGKLF